MSALDGLAVPIIINLFIFCAIFCVVGIQLEPKRKAEKRKPETAPEPGPDYKRIAELERLCSPPIEHVVSRAEHAAAYYYENPDRLYAQHPHVRDFGYPVVIPDVDD